MNLLMKIKSRCIVLPFMIGTKKYNGIFVCGLIQ